MAIYEVCGDYPEPLGRIQPRCDTLDFRFDPFADSDED